MEKKMNEIISLTFKYRGLKKQFNKAKIQYYSLIPSDVQYEILKPRYKDYLDNCALKFKAAETALKSFIKRR